MTSCIHNFIISTIQYYKLKKVFIFVSNKYSNRLDRGGQFQNSFLIINSLRIKVDNYSLYKQFYIIITNYDKLRLEPQPLLICNQSQPLNLNVQRVRDGTGLKMLPYHKSVLRNI